MLLSNGETFQLEVKHGKDGKRGSDGVGIATIIKTRTNENVDTYKILLTNDESFEFKVANGVDGKDGVDGVKGENGSDGKDGLSAYQIAVKNGFDGDEASWLHSLRGKDGRNGQSMMGDRGVGVSNATINSMGDLILSLTDGRQINSGNVTSNQRTQMIQLSGTSQTVENTFTHILQTIVTTISGEIVEVSVTITSTAIIINSNIDLTDHQLTVIGY
jgi:hypothetical protein